MEIKADVIGLMVASDNTPPTVLARSLFDIA